MKSTALVTAIAVLAALSSVAAHAQTGRPATSEAPSADDTPHVVAADRELGSYARYLMLNGSTRDEALAAARNVDHPAVRSRVASQARTPADSKATARQ